MTSHDGTRLRAHTKTLPADLRARLGYRLLLGPRETASPASDTTPTYTVITHRFTAEDVERRYTSPARRAQDVIDEVVTAAFLELADPRLVPVFAAKRGTHITPAVTEPELGSFLTANARSFSRRPALIPVVPATGATPTHAVVAFAVAAN